MSVEQPSGSNAVAAQAPAPTMMSQVPFPPRLELKSNLAKTWKSWKQLWDAYETVTGLNEKDSKLRVATFVTCIGPDALDIHNGLPFQNDEEKGDMNKILELWNSYCIGETNIIYERYKFNNRNQDLNESIDTYASALRALASTCDFGELKDQLIRDRIVCGMQSNAVRRKLLQEPKLTLGRCLDVCRAAEATSAQIKAMAGQATPSSDEVNLLRKGKRRSVPVKNQLKVQL